ncbi:MAG: hypothetical protein M0Z28_16900 [Rhodospirillales bacterium]|nr:hypothetical protein [Rhodospirillales bacterium]
MRHLVLAAALLAVLAPGVARSSQAEAEKCASGLPAPAKLIFDAVRHAPAQGVPLRDQIRQQTVSLVRAGRIERAHAKPAAQEAGVCLKMAQK